MIQPEQCRTLAEVRSAIDEVDNQIMALLGARFRFVEVAGRIKGSPDRISDDARNRQVLERMRTAAEAAGVPLALARELYAAVIKTSIEHQLRRIGDNSSNDPTD